MNDDSVNYLQEQARLYSKHLHSNNDGLAENDSIFSQRLNSGYSYLTGNKKPGDGRNLFDKFKSKLSLFKYEMNTGKEDDTMSRRQRQLWNIVRDKPIQLKDEEVTEQGLPKGKEQLMESANTFLTENATDRQIHATDSSTNSAKKRNNIPSVPLSGSPFASRGDTDYIGIEPDSFLGKDTTWDKLSGKSTLKRRTTLQTIQRRLMNISTRKQDVWKSYQKLLRELNEWWQDTMETEDSIRLISDLQRLFHEDLVYENRISCKLKEISKALEFTKLREDEMLQERKELHCMIKKYGQVRSKKGDQSEEANFLREKVLTKQNSLSVITGHYQQSLSTTARELFINASVEFFETSSDIKEASKEFFQSSVEHLRSIQAENIEQHIEDLRRKRADKHWSKLTTQEKSDPSRLVEIMSAMYNGQDSLMRCIGRNSPTKSFSKNTTGNENNPVDSYQPAPKLEYKTGLEDTWSSFPSERLNGISSHTVTSKAPKMNKLESAGIARDVSYTSMDPQQTLKCNNNSVLQDFPKQSRNLQTQGRNNTLRQTKKHQSDQENDSRHLHINVDKHSIDEDEFVDDGMIINFGTNNPNDFSEAFFEPEQELNRNKWAESPQQ